MYTRKYIVVVVKLPSRTVILVVMSSRTEPDDDIVVDVTSFSALDGVEIKSFSSSSSSSSSLSALLDAVEMKSRCRQAVRQFVVDVAMSRDS